MHVFSSSAAYAGQKEDSGSLTWRTAFMGRYQSLRKKILRRPVPQQNLTVGSNRSEFQKN